MIKVNSEGKLETFLRSDVLRVVKCVETLPGSGSHKGLMDDGTALRMGFVMDCQVPTDLESKDAVRNTSCSQQTPFAMSTRAVRAKWKISPSVQPNTLSACPSSIECCPWTAESLDLKHLADLRQHPAFGGRQRSTVVNKDWISTSSFEDLALYVTVGVA